MYNMYNMYNTNVQDVLQSVLLGVSAAMQNPVAVL